MPIDVDPQDTWRIFRIMSEFVEGFETMAGIGPAVTIFGSARTKPEDHFYQAAEKTGRLLAKAGYAVITGGGPGIMEAGNKGAFEASGKSIGLNISLPHEQETNRYQTTSIDFHYFYARKVMFVKYASAFICFPGGFGTLDEMFETLTLIQTQKIPGLPVILFGTTYWTGLVDWMTKQLAPHFIDSEDTAIFRIVDDPKDVISILRQAKRKKWWSPSDSHLHLPPNGKKKGPMSGALGIQSGEGTRYGMRPKRPGKKHAASRGKPQQ